MRQPSSACEPAIVRRSRSVASLRRSSLASIVTSNSIMCRSSFQGGPYASVCQRPAQQILRPLDPHEDCRSLAFGIAVLLRLDQTIPDALRDRVVLMDRRFAIEARFATF